jgi:hypothetical protein
LKWGVSGLVLVTLENTGLWMAGGVIRIHVRAKDVRNFEAIRIVGQVLKKDKQSIKSALSSSDLGN